MNLNIRKALPTDMPALCVLASQTFVENFGHLYHPDALRLHLEKTCSEAFFTNSLHNPNEVILLAEDKGFLVGYCKVGKLALPLEKPIQPACELHRFYLAPDFQGKGLGNRLMKAALALPLVAASKAIYVGVWEYNVRGQAFYKRHGFSEVGEYLYVVGETKDRELIMEKKLASR